VLIALAILGAGGLVAGCPATGANKGTQVGPPVPKDFTPPPPLGPEPPAPKELPGRPWLDGLHDRFYGAWSQGFLEQCRTFLPPSNALNNASLAVTLEIAVQADGQLASVTVKQPSGNADFDRAAKAVVTDAAPFDPPPAEFRSDDGLFYVTWLFARDQRQASLAGASIDKRLWTVDKAVPHLLEAGQWQEAARRVVEAHKAGGDPKALTELARSVAARVVELVLADESSATARRDAAKAAGRAKLAPLAASLRALATGSTDLVLRRVALEALGVMGDQDALPILSEAVASCDGDRSVVAARAMAALGARDKAFDLVSAKLADKDPAVRAAALATVAETGAPTAAGPLGQRLADKGAPRAERVAAARGLGEIAAAAPTSSGAALKPLFAALTDGDAAVRAAAAMALARAGQAGYHSRGTFYKVQPLLKDKDPQVRAAAVLAVAGVDAKAAAEELTPILAKDKDRTVLAACATALGLMPGADADKRLLKLAGSSEASVRLAALRALAGRPSPDAQKQVAALASSDDPALRLLALSQATDPPSVEAALDDPALDVKVAALEKLAHLQGAAALPRFIDLLLGASTPSERVRYAEAFLVGSAG
jgi:TonB family protein